MQVKHYLDNLYPLQDKVLNSLSQLASTFYLTGGTALGRHYLNHRFSDDLDFFFNRSTNFQKETQSATEELKKTFTLDVRVESESYVQLMIRLNQLDLKVEFVNDVGYRYGQPLPTSLFQRTDHWRNILSNKITALSRQAPKDIADIIFLSRKFEFNWIEIIREAGQKDSWINELEIFKMLDNFPVEKLSIVNWINEPNYLEMGDSLKTIAKDILLGTDNSLAKKPS
jgi:predicted nucleotidyltransferase component of viral defense system